MSRVVLIGEKGNIKDDIMQWDRHKKAKNEIKKIFNNLDKYRIIHYSCQSFNRVENGKSAVITSIGIHSCISDTTVSFDIQSVAERLKIDYDNIYNNLECVETLLLKDYFEYIKEDKNIIYLHWNMRDSQYGFQALSNRYCVLTGLKPEYEILPIHQLNIARLLEDYYGINYVADPKIKSLVEKNKSIEPKDILYGKEEADAFDDKKYNALHRSTLSKVRLFFNILKLVEDGKLNVDSTFLQSFGARPQVIYEMVREKWWWGLFTFIIGILVGELV